MRERGLLANTSIDFDLDYGRTRLLRFLPRSQDGEVYDDYPPRIRLDSHLPSRWIWRVLGWIAGGSLLYVPAKPHR